MGQLALASTEGQSGSHDAEQNIYTQQKSIIIIIKKKKRTQKRGCKGGLFGCRVYASKSRFPLTTKLKLHLTRSNMIISIILATPEKQTNKQFFLCLLYTSDAALSLIHI